jgi:hypothetical protein
MHPKILISVSLQHNVASPAATDMKELESMPKIDVTANIILYNLMLPSPVYSSLSSL